MLATWKTSYDKDKKWKPWDVWPAASPKHDFNNVMTVILGYSAVLLQELSQNLLRPILRPRNPARRGTLRCPHGPITRVQSQADAPTGLVGPSFVSFGAS